MSDPARLLTASTSPFTRSLLDAARHDRGSTEALEKIAEALGMSGADVALAVASGAPAVSTALPLSALVLKPLALGLLSGSLAAGAAHVAFAPDRTPPSTHAHAPAPVSEGETWVRDTERTGVRAASEIASPPPENAPRRTNAAYPSRSGRPSGAQTVQNGAAPPLAPVTPAPAPTAGVIAPSAVPVASSAPTASIAEEIAAVDAARRALQERRYAACLDALARYEARWPGGVLSTDVRVLRITALVESGERDAGLAEARAFLRTRPSGPYAGRVRALFDTGKIP